MLSKLVLDPRRRFGRLSSLEQQIDEDTISAVGRDAAGGGVRLVHVPGLFQMGQHVAHGRRRDPEPAVVREHL